MVHHVIDEKAQKVSELLVELQAAVDEMAGEGCDIVLACRTKQNAKDDIIEGFIISTLKPKKAAVTLYAGLAMVQVILAETRVPKGTVIN